MPLPQFTHAQTLDHDRRAQTSVSLEDEFWDELAAIADGARLSLNALVTEIDKVRTSPRERRRQSVEHAAACYVLTTRCTRKISRA